MAANQNPQQPQGQAPQQQAPQQGQGPQYGYPPPGYYPPPQYCAQQPAQKEEGIGVWTALGLVGAGFLLGQLFSEPSQPQMQSPPPQPGLKMPWQK
jgi:hypothetical protein